MNDIIYPVLYDSNATSFVNMGLGSLCDYEDWNVIEERNGPFEFEMIYPVEGLHYSEIGLRSIITAKPDPYRDPEPFRVYEITRPINGRVKIFAKHLSYDLNGIPVRPFTALNSSAAVVEMNQDSMISNPFTMYTDTSTTSTMEIFVPMSYRSLLGGQEGSILDHYGGEYEFTGYDVHLWHQRGTDISDSVVLRYGKNISSIEQDENCENVYTGIIGYWTGKIIDYETDEEYTETVWSDTIWMTENPPYQHVYVVDLTEVFEEKPTVELLNTAAREYGNEVGINVPNISIELTYEQDPEVVEVVKLCDIISVEFEKLGISTKAKVIKTIYNGPRNRFKSIDIGDAKSTFASTISSTISTDISESRQDLITQAREIVQRFEKTAEGFSAAISDNQGNITDLWASINDIGLSISDMMNKLSLIIDPESATINFEQFANYINNAIQEQTNSYSSDLSTIKSYIRFGSTNGIPWIVLGHYSSNYKLKILSDKMFFYKGDNDDVMNIDGTDANGNEVADVFAYFTNDELTALSVRIGTEKNINTYIWTRRDDGHLSLRLA